MTAPLSLEKYPQWMMALAEEFEAGLRSKTLQCASPKEAIKLRVHLYGLQRALKQSNMQRDYPNFGCLRIVIRGTDLTLVHADDYLPKPPDAQ